MVQASLRSQKPAHPLLGAILVVLSFFTLLSLISYSKTDPSWNFASTDSDTISNLGGLVGSFLSDSLLQSLGLVSYLLTFAIGLIGLQKLQIRIVAIDEITREASKKRKWKLPLGLSVGSICLSGLLSLIPLSIYGNIPVGGFLGYLVARLGTFLFSPIGAAVIFLGGLWIASVLITEKAGRLPRFALPKLQLPKFQFALPKFGRKSPPIHLQPSSQAKPTFSFNFKKSEDAKVHTDDVVANSPTNKSEGKPLPLFRKPVEISDDTKDGDRKLLVEGTDYNWAASRKIENYEFPSLQLLETAPDENLEVSKEEMIENSRALEQKLFDFGIQGQVVGIRPGPIITLYEFEPAAGVKVKNITNLTDDLKLALKSTSIRILAPIPGKAAVGIEIPNARRRTVSLKEILEAAMFKNSPSPLTMALGKATSGEPTVADLAKMPHLLIAGATGSGKSVGLNGMIVSMLYKASPEDLKFIMIDPKMLELSFYEGIPHLLLPVVTDPKKAAKALQWAVKEMERRYRLISSLGARNLKSYNEKVERLSHEELAREIEKAQKQEQTTSAIIDTDEEDLDHAIASEASGNSDGLETYVKLPSICIVIDELADLIMVAARDVEESIARLAQMARAAGIHLIVATQRPSVDVITGVIKANFPTRIAYQVASKVDSRTIIDGTGAENLIGDGDMLFLPPGTSRLTRLHGPFISDDEIQRVVKHLRGQGSAEYLDSSDWEDRETSSDVPGDEYNDELYDSALQVVFETKSPSASMLQRRLRIGYNRAARLVERMEAEGIISAPLGGGKGRELLVTPSHSE